MSTQAIVHPDDLHRFAEQLAHYRNDLESSTAKLKAQFSTLGDTWRDLERERFEREFEETVKVINHFISIADEHIPFLHRKAERAQEYLDQR